MDSARVGLWEQLGNVEKIEWRAVDLAGLREIRCYQAHDGLGGHRHKSLFAEVCSQRFQNQLKKIVDRTAFHVDQLALAHDRLVAPANQVPAPAKDLAQSVCKNTRHSLRYI
jgi:hypothetical protein